MRFYFIIVQFILFHIILYSSSPAVMDSTPLLDFHTNLHIDFLYFET